MTDMSFWQKHGDLISALATVVLTLVVAKLADFAIMRRAHGVAARIAGGELTAQAETRFRVLRRLVVLIIFVVGSALALSYLSSAHRLAGGILASSALLGLVAGFAARATLANLVAGLMLVATQVVRVGDRVRWQEQTGTVEDVRLNYTFVKTAHGHRLVIPNSALASTTFENLSLIDPITQVEVSLWLPIDAEIVTVRRLITDSFPEASISVAELAEDKLRIELKAEATEPGNAEQVAAELREKVLARLQAAGVFPTNQGT